MAKGEGKDREERTDRREDQDGHPREPCNVDRKNDAQRSTPDRSDADDQRWCYAVDGCYQAGLDVADTIPKVPVRRIADDPAMAMAADDCVGPVNSMWRDSLESDARKERQRAARVDGKRADAQASPMKNADAPRRSAPGGNVDDAAED